MKKPSKSLGSKTKRVLVDKSKMNQTMINKIANDLVNYFNTNTNNTKSPMTPLKSIRRK